MRRSTIAYTAGLAIALACLVASLRAVWRPRRGGARREFVFAFWGAEKKTWELLSLVVEPVNAEAAGYEIKPVPIPTDYYTKLYTMIAAGCAALSSRRRS